VEQWFKTKQHRKPKTLAGYRSLLDTVVLPKWGEVPLRRTTASLAIRGLTSESCKGF
jgi:hypothetical protein